MTHPPHDALNWSEMSIQEVLALAITAALGPSILHAMVALSITWWPGYCRLVQAQVLVWDRSFAGGRYGSDIPSAIATDLENNVVISGEAPAVSAVIETLTVEGIETRTLHVSHAFHSPLISLKAGIMNLLSVCAAYGVMTLAANGGGISNLDPEQSSIIEQRIKAWQAEWERKIQAVAGEGKANAIWEVERAHAQAQAALIAAIHDVVKDRPGIDPELLTKIAALRFIEALEDMACTPHVREALPESTAETMGMMRKVLS